MKRFSFRLEQVRRWRQEQAELEDIRLEQLHANLHAVQQEHDEMAATADRTRRTVLAQASVTGEELAALEAFDEYAKHEMLCLKVKKQEIQTRIVEQRRRVLEARRGFQLLDRLRDKALVAWTAARDKEQEELGAELYLGQLARGKRFQ